MLYKLHVNLVQEQVNQIQTISTRQIYPLPFESAPTMDFTDHQRRYYQQGPFVLYEVDFGFLDNLSDMKQVTTNLGQTVESIVGALSKGSG